MSIVDDLCKEYERILKLRWPSGLSGEERVWFVVYDPSSERRIRAHVGQFELLTRMAGQQWRVLDIEPVFAEWMADNEYREQMFANPASVPSALTVFRRDLGDRLRSELARSDDATVVAVLGAASLYGLWSLSELISAVADSIQGVLLVFFPGRHERTNYRLMDARSSFNYLALAIEAKVGSPE